MGTEQLIAFSDSNDAYERRGYVRGIRVLHTLIENLYAETSNVRERDAIFRSDISGTRIEVPRNPADEDSTDYSY